MPMAITTSTRVNAALVFDLAVFLLLVTIID
jgi:hypothetical protein